jgi:hypothetical protein
VFSAPEKKVSVHTLTHDTTSIYYNTITLHIFRVFVFVCVLGEAILIISLAN